MKSHGKHENLLTLFGIGPLEREVLAVLYEKRLGSVRDVLGSLDRPLAYTTVMTTLDRLYKKHLLERHKAGRGFLYALRFLSRPEHNDNAVSVSAKQPTATEGSLISYLVDVVGDYDDALLQQLEQAIVTRRQQLKQTGEEP